MMCSFHVDRGKSVTTNRQRFSIAVTTVLLAICGARTTENSAFVAPKQGQKKLFFQTAKTVRRDSLATPRRRTSRKNRTVAVRNNEPVSFQENHHRDDDDDEDDDAALLERLDLSNHFQRWVFLQRLLDGEHGSPADVERVVYRSVARCDDDEDDDEKNTDAVRSLRRRWETSREIPVLTDASLSLAELEAVLPDPEDDEDAYQGIWDIVTQLQGADEVERRRELGEDDEWHRLCISARLLIHFDFLSKGIALSKSS